MNHSEALKMESSAFPIRHIRKSEQDQAEPKFYECKPWMESLDKINHFKKGFIAALVGGRGNGKTQLAVCAAASKCNTQSVLYCTAMDFFIEIKSTFGRNDGDTERDVLSLYSRPSFLVIDEFDKRAATEWENNLLFYLIDRRYRAVKSTLVISNSTPTVFSESIGDSLVSRMNETGGIIICDWPSFRV